MITDKGHSIPYHFTPTEQQTFIAGHASYPPLVAYLNTNFPPYGIIVNDQYGEILVWRDAAKVLHIVDVTNLRIAKSVQQAPYVSPDSSVFLNMRDDFASLFGGLSVAVPWLAIGAVAVAIIFITWKR